MPELTELCVKGVQANMARMGNKMSFRMIQIKNIRIPTLSRG